MPWNPAEINQRIKRISWSDWTHSHELHWSAYRNVASWKSDNPMPLIWTNSQRITPKTFPKNERNQTKIQLTFFKRFLAKIYWIGSQAIRFLQELLTSRKDPKPRDWTSKVKGNSRPNSLWSALYMISVCIEGFSKMNKDPFIGFKSSWIYTIDVYKALKYEILIWID